MSLKGLFESAASWWSNVRKPRRKIVSATGQAGSVGTVSSVSVTIYNSDTTAPSVPTGLTATGGDQQISLSCNASSDPAVNGAATSGLAGYRWYVATAPTGTYSLLATTVSPSYTHTGLGDTATRYYKVASYDNAGNQSDQTSYVVATTSTPAGNIGTVAGTIYNDGFEPVAGRTWTTSTDSLPSSTGFQWDSWIAASIVKDGTPDGFPTGTAVFNGSPINNTVAGASSSDIPWVPRSSGTGTHLLRLRYAAGASQSELRFDIGAHNPDLWMRYWIRIPKQYSHPSGGLNQKWLAIWCANYDELGDITFQLRPAGSGNSQLVVQDGGVAVGEVTVWTDFINATRDRGRWMQMVYRFIPATGATANDGTIAVYRRWENESSWTQIYNKTNARFYQNDGSPSVGIHQGYLMGWANSAYSVDTEFLVDDFALSATDLR